MGLKFRFMDIIATTVNEYIVKDKKCWKLGDIKYYKKWKCWVFEPVENTIFSSGCLSDISYFLFDLDRKGVPNEK